MATHTYEVVAPSRVLGHEPGSRFEADLPPLQHVQLLRSNALKVVGEASDANVAATGDTAHDELDHLSREELNELAAAKGVEGADELPNKAAVAEAIAAHESGTEPEGAGTDG